VTDIVRVLSTPTPPEQDQPETISLPLERKFGGFTRESVQAAVAELTRRLTELQQQAVDATARLQPLHAERDALRAERDALAGERDALAAERDELRRERDTVTAERDQLAARPDVQDDGLARERDALAAERDGLTRERDSLAEQLSAVTRERDALADLPGSLGQGGPAQDEVVRERDELLVEVTRYRTIERSLAQTLALAEEAAQSRHREAEAEAQKILDDARGGALHASRVAESERDRAVADVAQIREQLQRALTSLDQIVRA
jgi:methyl-accepting chemotaxis protein